MPKRKLFSKKDGSTFGEDVKDIAEDVAAFIKGIPAKLKSYLPEATDIVEAIEALDDALQDGQPLDAAIDHALSFIPSTGDEVVYEKIKDLISDLADFLREKLDDAQDLIDYVEGGAIKAATASQILAEYATEFDRIETDTTVQLAVYLFKK